MSENENVNNEEIENSSVSSGNSQELFNLIQSIQSKMNMTNTEENNQSGENSDKITYTENNNNVNESTNNNLNELFDNVLNTTKNVDNNKNNNNSNSMDFSSIASLLQNIDLSSIIGMFSNKSNSNNNSNINNNSNENFNNSTNLNNDSIFGGIDPATILKFQRVLSSMNKSDPKKNLLLSLKPFLRKSRQDKLNEYVTMLTIANAIGIFGSKGSDE